MWLLWFIRISHPTFILVGGGNVVSVSIGKSIQIINIFLNNYNSYALSKHWLYAGDALFIMRSLHFRILIWLYLVMNDIMYLCGWVQVFVVIIWQKPNNYHFLHFVLNQPMIWPVAKVLCNCLWWVMPIR